MLGWIEALSPPDVCAPYSLLGKHEENTMVRAAEVLVLNRVVSFRVVHVHVRGVVSSPNGVQRRLKESRGDADERQGRQPQTQYIA